MEGKTEEMVREALNKVTMNKEERSVTMEMFKWIDNMNEKFGPEVTSVEGKTFDWGQALCREIFGPNWMSEMASQKILAPRREDLETAYSMELLLDEGKPPKWMKETSGK